ncbi:MAG: hypothetical protein A3E05_04275 [Candidatus Jacksonbacteria bacterium RIFCSPHIGHO2_12_FULL_44_12]|nr:MAG: hypothetical protein A3E05_04275 [Candidatus Jacksonbacteria bacterium RIFCSPHIGHO2_12_FULL_44_12]
MKKLHLLFTIKTLSRAEHRGKENGDAFFVKKVKGTLIAGVFDGATELKITDATRRLPHSSATFAALHCSQSAACMLQKPASTPSNAILCANRELKKQAIRYGLNPDDSLTVPKTTATVIKIDTAQRFLTWAHIGDSILLIASASAVLKPTKKQNKITENEFLAQLKFLAEKTGKPPIALIHDPTAQKYIIATQNQANNSKNPKSYGVLTGQSDERIRPFIERGGFTITEKTDVILASDGAIPHHMNDLETNDQQKAYMTLIREKRLANLYRFIRKQENSDPLHILYPRYKTHDDFTIIWIHCGR